MAEGSTKEWLLQLGVTEATAQMELRTPGHVRPKSSATLWCSDLEAAGNAELFVLSLLWGSAGRGRNAHSFIQNGWSKPKAHEPCFPWTEKQQP